MAYLRRRLLQKRARVQTRYKYYEMKNAVKDFGMVMAHNGVPIIVNDFMLATEMLNGSALTGGTYASIYAGRLNEADGLHGLYGGDSAGIVVEDIGTVQNKDATRTRLKWYTGLALKSTASLARIHGLSNV